MKITKITCVFFSATGLTEKTADAFLSALPLPAEKIDITPFSARGFARTFGPDELAVWAAPVYGGRIPAAAKERFLQLKGTQTPAVLLAVFGNRDYDDALLEMCDLALAGGLVPAACAAPVAEHSIMHSVAAGRPDAADREKLAAFAQAVWRKLENAADISSLSLPFVKGRRPYMAYPNIPFKPAASAACIQCGKCARECPVNAIPADAPEQTDKTRCISCMRCISVCPAGARGLNKIALALAEKVFAFKHGARKEPEFFI
ncbi:4Fe-4S binding protein [Candidatus Avelusimicrobium alvi]|uniref:4Fe-4S binding protein n=1 Tax=Candidatus Avelusimicrobium alvi TaxID=3416221 RepID=UPI003D0D8D13